MPRRVALMFDLDEASHHIRELVRGVHRYATEHPGRWHCVHDPYALDRLRNYDGLIARGSKPLLRAVRSTRLPVVITTGRQHKLPLPCVVENRWYGGALAARHLVERGYRQFAYLGFGFNMASTTLEHGFCYALRSRGQGFLVERHAWRRRRTKKARTRFRDHLGELLDELDKPVGILAARDVLTLYLADLCVRKGLRIPHDVGLVGAGNDPAVCLGAPLPLTSIDFAYERVGYRAAALLDHLMAGGAPPMGNVLIRPTLVARPSTGRAFFSDTVVADALAYIVRHCHRPIRVATWAASSVSARASFCVASSSPAVAPLPRRSLAPGCATPRTSSRPPTCRSRPSPAPSASDKAATSSASSATTTASAPRPGAGAAPCPPWRIPPISVKQRTCCGLLGSRWTPWPLSVAFGMRVASARSSIAASASSPAPTAVVTGEPTPMPPTRRSANDASTSASAWTTNRANRHLTV